MKTDLLKNLFLYSSDEKVTTIPLFGTRCKQRTAFAGMPSRIKPSKISFDVVVLSGTLKKAVQGRSGVVLYG